MKTSFILKAICTVVAFILIIGAFMGLAPLNVSASSSNLYADPRDTTQIYAKSWLGVYPTNTIGAHLSENWVDADFWPVNSLLTLTISGSGESYTAQGTTLPDSWGTGSFRFKLGAAFDLKPGQTVTISDGIFTTVITVMDLYVDSFNPAEKTIAGHSDPNVEIWVDIWVAGSPYPYQQDVMADGTGSWQAKFGAFYDPFSPFTDGTASHWDNGNATVVRLNMGFMNAMANAWPGADNIFYTNCALPRSYTLSIDNPSNGPGVDYEDTQPCTLFQNSLDPTTYLNFILNGFVLNAGDQISVASGRDIRTLTVTIRGAQSFDTFQNIISGANQPNNYLTITTPGASRTIRTGPDGKWSIDYSVPGPNGEPIEDIVPGMKGSVEEFDADGDSTSYGWQVIFLQYLPVLLTWVSTVR